MTDPNAIIKSTSEKMLAIVNEIAGSKKRHDAILQGLIQEKVLKNNRELNRQPLHTLQMAEYLSRKLKKDEGIIVSYNFIHSILGSFPSELIIAELANSLTAYDLSLIPIYQKGAEGNTISTMTTIHRKHYKAMDYSDRLIAVMQGKEKPAQSGSQLVKTAMKVGEELGRTKVPDVNDLYNALLLLEGDEVYCVSMAYCYGTQIDPRALYEKLEADNFHVCRLLNEAPKETVEVYKFYDGLFALAVSRTEAGVKYAQENLDLLFKIVAATESDLPKPSNSVVNMGSGYKQ